MLRWKPVHIVMDVMGQLAQEDHTALKQFTYMLAGTWKKNTTGRKHSRLHSKRLSSHWGFWICLNFYKIWVMIPFALGGSLSSLSPAARLDYANWLSPRLDLTMYEVQSGDKPVDLLSGDRLINKMTWAAFQEFFSEPNESTENN